MFPTNLHDFITTNALYGSSGSSPQHDKHIEEVARCLEENLSSMWSQVIQAFMQQNELLEDLAARVEKLEKQQFTPQQVEAELVITKRSIKKAQDIFKNLFHF